MVDFATYSPLPQLFSIFDNILHTNLDRVGKPETTYACIFLPNLNLKYPNTPAFELDQYPMSQKCSWVNEVIKTKFQYNFIHFQDFILFSIL